MSKAFLIGILFIIIGGAALWYVAYNPSFPGISQAFRLSNTIEPDTLKSEVSRIDHDVATFIRSATSGDFSFSSWNPAQEVAGAMQSVSQATISASVTTTPEELWQTLREEGAQAVIGSLANQAQVSVNSISTDVMNEARYQYCIGVVDQYNAEKREQKNE